VRIVAPIMALAILLLAVVPAAGVQHNPPWAHLNSTYIDPDLDSTKLGWAEGWVEQMGYDCYAPVNLSAYSVYRWWKDDSLMLFAGHGLAGGG